METIKKLSMDELEQVNGGGFCFIVGFGLDAAACAEYGSQALSDKGMEGIGAYACMGPGLGMGGMTELGILYF